MPYTGLPRGSLNAYASPLKNSCAQSAAACVLDYYGFKSPAMSRKDFVATLYAALPPDNLGGVFGTSPGRTEKILKLSPQMQTTFFNRKTAGGNGRAHLEEWLRQNVPVICIVDTGKLGHGMWAHFVVAFAYDEDGVWIMNSLATATMEQMVPWHVWHDAWECWFMPSDELKFVGLVPLYRP